MHIGSSNYGCLTVTLLLRVLLDDTCAVLYPPLHLLATRTCTSQVPRGRMRIWRFYHQFYQIESMIDSATATAAARLVEGHVINDIELEQANPID